MAWEHIESEKNKLGILILAPKREPEYEIASVIQSGILSAIEQSPIEAIDFNIGADNFHVSMIGPTPHNKLYDCRTVTLGFKTIATVYVPVPSGQGS